MVFSRHPLALATGRGSPSNPGASIYESVRPLTVTTLVEIVTLDERRARSGLHVGQLPQSVRHDGTFVAHPADRSGVLVQFTGLVTKS